MGKMGRKKREKAGKKRKISTHLPGLPAQSGQVRGTRPPMQLWIIGSPDILPVGRIYDVGNVRGREMIKGGKDGSKPLDYKDKCPIFARAAFNTLNPRRVWKSRSQMLLEWNFEIIQKYRSRRKNTFLQMPRKHVDMIHALYIGALTDDGLEPYDFLVKTHPAGWTLVVANAM